MDNNYSKSPNANQTLNSKNIENHQTKTPKYTLPTEKINDLNKSNTINDTIKKENDKDHDCLHKPLLTTSPEALKAANMINPKRIAGILQKNGPSAIRYITKELGKQVANFNKLSTSKQRRLIMHAMEMGDKDEKIIFQKVSWGHWSVVILSSKDIANFELIRNKVNLNNLENNFDNVSSVFNLNNNTCMIKDINTTTKSKHALTKRRTNSVPEVSIGDISILKTTYLDDKVIDSDSENEDENEIQKDTKDHLYQESKSAENVDSNEIIHLGVRRHSTVVYSNYNRLSVGSQKIRSSSIPFILNNKNNNNNTNTNTKSHSTNSIGVINKNNKKRRHSNFISKDRIDLNQIKSMPLSYQSNVRSTLFNDLKKFSFANNTTNNTNNNIHNNLRRNSDMSPPISPITKKIILPPIQHKNSNLVNINSMSNKETVKLPSLSTSLYSTNAFNLNNKNNIPNYTFLDNSVLNNNYTYHINNNSIILDSGLTFSDSEDEEDWPTSNNFSHNGNFTNNINSTTKIVAPITNDAEMIKIVNNNNNSNNNINNNNNNSSNSNINNTKANNFNNNNQNTLSTKYNKQENNSYNTHSIKVKNENDIAVILMSLKS